MSAPRFAEVRPEPLHGDPWCQAMVRRLVRAFDPAFAIETGTARGATARFLASLVGEVHTVEVDPLRHREASERLIDLPEVHCHLGDSATLLRHLVPELPGRLFVYLDAHDDERWPLYDELLALALHARDRAVICIDHFLVPYRPYAFASPGGVPNDLGGIADVLPALGDDPWWFYCDYAGGPTPTGKLYIAPEQFFGPIAPEWVHLVGELFYAVDRPLDDP